MNLEPASIEVDEHGDVACKDCKWLMWEPDDEHNFKFPGDCMHPACFGSGEYDALLGDRRKEREKSYFEMNEDGNCIHFERRCRISYGWVLAAILVIYEIARLWNL